MLVLSRLRDETIMIGDDIEITVVDIRGDKVRLGINVPTRIAVHRKEVYVRIKEERARAGMLGEQVSAPFNQTTFADPRRSSPPKPRSRQKPGSNRSEIPDIPGPKPLT